MHNSQRTNFRSKFKKNRSVYVSPHQLTVKGMLIVIHGFRYQWHNSTLFLATKLLTTLWTVYTAGEQRILDLYPSRLPFNAINDWRYLSDKKYYIKLLENIILYLSNEPSELAQWLRHDDSAINIDFIIVKPWKILFCARTERRITYARTAGDFVCGLTSYTSYRLSAHFSNKSLVSVW